jgi:hypothetical protein
MEDGAPMLRDNDDEFDELELEAEPEPRDLDFPPDPELIAQGWERRFMADPARAKEAVALYTELGYEVRAEPIRQVEMGPDCGDCRVATYMGFVTIYTRKQEASGAHA